MFDVQQTLQDLEDLIAFMREAAWIQNRHFDSRGGFCAHGAALMVTGDLNRTLVNQDRSADIGRAFFRHTGWHLLEYNDAEGRTKDEVIAMLVETQAALKATPSLLTAKKADDRTHAIPKI